MKAKVITLLFILVPSICLLAQEIQRTYKWSWMKENPTVGTTPVDQLLQKVSGTISPMVCLFDKRGVLQEKRSFVLSGKDGVYTSTWEERGTKWECEARMKPDKKDGYFIDVKFRLLKGSVDAAVVAVSFDFDNWSKENYVLIPCAAYNGNRFPYYPVSYPSHFKNKGDSKQGDPNFITDISKLSVTDTPQKMENGTGDAATPMIGFWDKAGQKNFFVFTEYETAVGQSGLIVEESDKFDRSTLIISAPAMREYSSRGSDQIPSTDRPIAWESGKELTVRLYVKVDDSSKEIASFFESFFEDRKILTGANEFRNKTPYSKIFSDQEEWQRGPSRWKEDFGHYKNGNGNSIFGNIQLGWVGGLIQTYPLLLRGDEDTQKKVYSTMNVVFDNMQGKTGFLAGVYKEGVIYGDVFSDHETYRNIVMTRKNADVLYFMLKQLSYIRENGVEFKDFAKMEKCVNALADAFVTLYERYGELGQLVDIETGELFAYGSTAPAIAPAALVFASEYFNNPRYLEVAKKVAEQYYHRDVVKGYTTGGPGEILQCPDSESAFAMLESFVVLYEVTGKKRWIKMAEEMAHICSSWVVSSDFDFPEESHFGKSEIRSTGSVWASIQNRHAAPGICTASGDCLLKLYRITGNPLYLELIKDIAHNIVEFISTKTHPINCPKGIEGLVSERVNISDWEGEKGIGSVLECDGTSWCEVASMQVTTEIPSIYIQVDKGEITCFDHLEAKIISYDKDGVLLSITNPTLHSAVASLFAETSANAKKNMIKWNLYPRMPKINIAAGVTKQIRINLDGKISE